MKKVIIDNNGEWVCPHCGASQGFKIYQEVGYNILDNGKKYELEEWDVVGSDGYIICNSCASEVDYPDDAERR